jgi:hypothetical protein
MILFDDPFLNDGPLLEIEQINEVLFGGKKFWFNPSSGEFIETQNEHHTDFVTQHPHQFGLTPEDVWGANPTQDQNILMRLLTSGWVRGRRNGSELEIEGRSPGMVKKAFYPLMDLLGMRIVDKVIVDIRNGTDASDVGAREFIGDDIFRFFK